MVPAQVAPGGPISHRLIFTMCPDAQRSSLRGRLSTTIFLGYKEVFTGAGTGFELQPGSADPAAEVAAGLRSW